MFFLRITYLLLDYLAFSLFVETPNPRAVSNYCSSNITISCSCIILKLYAWVVLTLKTFKSSCKTLQRKSWWMIFVPNNLLSTYLPILQTTTRPTLLFSSDFSHHIFHIDLLLRYTFLCINVNKVKTNIGICEGKQHSFGKNFG